MTVALLFTNVEHCLWLHVGALPVVGRVGISTSVSLSPHLLSPPTPFPSDSSSPNHAPTMPLTIQVSRARGLPQPRLFRSPDPYVEVHYFAGGAAVATSPPARKTIAPAWPDFQVVVSPAPADSPPRAIGLIVRDASSRSSAGGDTVLGRAFLRVAASVTEGWFALDADAEGPRSEWAPARDVAAYTAPGAEIYLRVEWPEYCAVQLWAAAPVFEGGTVEDRDMVGELRSVACEPGRFFRCGELVVAVRALGVAVAMRDPQLVLHTHDQSLRGYEALPEAGSPTVAEGGQSEERKFRPVLTKGEYSNAKKTGARREVDFGTFAFALFQGSFPESLCVGMRERGSKSLQAMAGRLLGREEQTIPLPSTFPGCDARVLKELVEGSLEGAGKRVHFTNLQHIIHFRATSPGAVDDKVTFDVRITYNLHSPTAACHMVAPRFRSLLAGIEDLSTDFCHKYPQAQDLTYMFVGGLFTTHYPKYFEQNIDYLKTVLGLKNVTSAPIHTEGSVTSNAKIIRDSVVEAAGGKRSVVLLSHSKGGCDVCGAIDFYPELADLLFGVVSFQAPFSGTYLVSFVAKSKLAIGAITGVIKKLWGGESEAFTDMCYARRLCSVLGLDVESNPDDSEVESDVVGDVDVDAATRVVAVGTEGSTGEGARELGPVAGTDIALERAASSGVVMFDDHHVSERLRLFAAVPSVSFGSSAPFSVGKVRTVANAAGFASMAPAAQVFTANTGFYNDGLVAPDDARIPWSDFVYLSDMMHTEPALYFAGTKYPPGHLSAVGITLLFEKRRRECVLY